MSSSNRRPAKGSYADSLKAAQEAGLLEKPNQTIMTRRSALKALLGVSVASAAALGNPLRALATPSASQETLNALSSAEAQMNEAQAQLDVITEEYVQLSEQLNETVNKIEEVQAQIDTKQAEIDEKQAELEKKQEQLGDRIAQDYKTGNTDFLSVLLNSASFEELSSNIFYMGKINASDEELINEVKNVKAELEQDKAELEQDKAELETLRASQAEQVEAVAAKQQEASDLVASLSDEVKALIEKRDAEILAAAEEEKRQAAAAAAARAQGGSGVTGTITYDNITDKGAAIVNASTSVGSPGSGLCAMWVSMVYQAAGLGYPGGNANNMYWNFCTSSNKGDLMPGMIIAVSTWTGTSAGRTYGHVGIYVGNNTVRHNIGYITTMDLDAWINMYSTTVTPRWGWAA